MLGATGGTVLVLAHRGASVAAPPNTLEAFRRAGELHADGVELDVRLSADSHPVVLHDPTVEGTTEHAGFVNAYTAAELGAMDAAWWFGDAAGPGSWRGRGIGVPTLEDALDVCAERGLIVNVEIKNVPTDPLYDASSTLAVDVARRVVERAETDRVFLSSFNKEDMAAVRSAVPGVAVALLSVQWAAAEAVRAARGAAMSGWHPEVHDLMSAADGPAAALSAARAASCWVAPWTVNDPEMLRRLVDLRVDAVITDVPDVARQIITPEGA